MSFTHFYVWKVSGLLSLSFRLLMYSFWLLANPTCGGICKFLFHDSFTSVWQQRVFEHLVFFCFCFYMCLAHGPTTQCSSFSEFCVFYQIQILCFRVLCFYQIQVLYSRVLCFYQIQVLCSRVLCFYQIQIPPQRQQRQPQPTSCQLSTKRVSSWPTASHQHQAMWGQLPQNSGENHAEIQHYKSISWPLM